MMIATEFVTMKIVSGTLKEDFVSIVDALEKNFHSKLSGFIDSELLYDEEADEWCMVQHWMSPEQLKSASKKMFKAADAAYLYSCGIADGIRFVKYTAKL